MRILVIEDNVRIAEALKRSLSQEHFAVDLVFDGESGLAHAIDSDYDLIILDWMLPDGLTAPVICSSLRDKNIMTPILILSARGQLDDRILGLSQGADDYMVKPFSMEELIVRVRVLLRRPKKVYGPIITIGDLTVNLENYQVKRSDSIIDLSAREFKLLSYFMNNQGVILSKDNIINHVWDGDSYVLPNTIEVYIGYLRKKIDRSFPKSPKLIHTIHGFGYRLGE